MLDSNVVALVTTMMMLIMLIIDVQDFDVVDSFVFLSYFFFCLQRNKRRWTVCPMGALSKPPLPFDLTSSFDHELINSNKRIKANRSSSSSSSPDSINSPDFNQNNLDRFLADIGEKEEEVEEMPDNVNISRRR